VFSFAWLENTTLRSYVAKDGVDEALTNDYLRCAVSNVITQAGWYHLAGTYNGTNCKLYLNGKELTATVTSTGTGNFTPRNADLFIGTIRV